MEMLVVVAIIAALASVGGYYYLKALEDSKVSMARSQVKNTLSEAVDTYAMHHQGQYPDSLRRLLEQDEFGGPYLKTQEAIMDPWGREYVLQLTGNGYEIYTTSPKNERISSLDIKR
jgi:general secretion pathway protein G